MLDITVYFVLCYTKKHVHVQNVLCIAHNVSLNTKEQLDKEDPKLILYNRIPSPRERTFADLCQRKIVVVNARIKTRQMRSEKRRHAPHADIDRQIHKLKQFDEEIVQIYHNKALKCNKSAES